jgi:hypothetical protein
MIVRDDVGYLGRDSSDRGAEIHLPCQQARNTQIVIEKRRRR